MILPIEDIFDFLCFEHETIGLIFLDKEKSSLLWLIKIVYVVFMCIIWLFIDVMPGNARESLKKYACWKIIICLNFSKSTI